MSERIIELPDIVQSLQNKQWTGTLEIQAKDETDRTTHLFFRGGMIMHCAPDRNPVVLGRALYDLELIDEADYVMTMADYEQSGRKVGEVLVELGLVDQDDIRRALLHQGREHVLSAFTWKQIDVKFHAGEDLLGERFTPEQREVTLGLGGMSVLMEVARREDEQSRIDDLIPSNHDVLAPASPEGLSAGTVDRRVALLIDGYRSGREIAQQVPMDTGEVLVALAELVQQGALKRLEPAELVKVGLVAEQDGDHEKALGVYELAISRGLDQLELQQRLARIYGALGRRSKALAQWVKVVDRCRESQRSDLAIAALKEAIELDPDDVDLRQRLAALLVDAQENEQAAEQLRHLVAMAEARKAKPPELVALIDQLLELDAADKAMLERVAQLHLEQEEPLEAMTRLDELATVLVSEGAPDAAVATYYRVLEIDAENLQARLLLAQTLADKGSTDDAVREYRRLADILFRSGVIGNSINWPFLIRVYESIVELEPSATEAWEWLAKAYLENNQQDLAISRYVGMADSLEPADRSAPPHAILQPLRRVIELSPNDLAVRRRLAETHLRMGQAPRAVRCLRELAEVCVRLEDFDQARAGFREALGHDPFDLGSRRGLAEIHERFGERDQAFDAWRTAGSLCLRAGLLDQAVMDLHRAFQIRGDDAMTLRNLAEVEERRGKNKNGAMLYARYALAMIQQRNFGMAQDAIERAQRLEPSLPQLAQLHAKLATAS